MRTAAAAALGHEASEPAPVEQQRGALTHLKVHDETRHDLVVAPVVNLPQFALDHGQRTLDHGCAGYGAGTPAHAVELVATRNCECPTHRLLVLTQNIDAERARRGDAWPARGRASGRQKNHGRVERQRREGLAREAHGDILFQRSDDRDPGGKAPEHLAEPKRLETPGIIESVTVVEGVADQGYLALRPTS